jgi:hypothetical protein
VKPNRHAGSRWVATVTPTVAILLVCLTAVAAAQATGDRARWRPRVSTGIDAYLHNYYLAVDDTTEAVAEFNVAAELEGRSRRVTSHQWRVRGEVSTGTELTRQFFDGSYQLRPDAGDPLLRADLTWYGRQYREDSEYARSSDNHEGRGELRWYPWFGARTVLDLRLTGRYIDYRTPSTLEQDYRQGDVAAFLRSPGLVGGSWRIGLRAGQRAYPDSSAIDRDTVALEGDLDLAGDDHTLWVFHRSERRTAADEAVRPSAWSHWTDARAALPAGEGHVVINLNNEVWQYDQETGAYFDSWRSDLEFGYRWGDLLGTQWHTLLTVDRLDAGDLPETYTQVGLRGSLESYAYPFTGILALEYGQRWYRPADDTEDVVISYTDFSYLEIWAMATWSLSEHWSLDLIANYQPENHTEQDDDLALGFGSLRLVWRP